MALHGKGADTVREAGRILFNLKPLPFRAPSHGKARNFKKLPE
jgi:hypothetical protein